MAGRGSRSGDAGPYNLKALCKLETLDCLRTLKRVRDNQKAPALAQVRAAEAILDRGWGRPTQYVEVAEHRDVEGMTDAELLEIIRGGGVAAPPTGSGQPH
jgi:hypothetical protein